MSPTDLADLTRSVTLLLPLAVVGGGVAWLVGAGRVPGLRFAARRARPACPWSELDALVLFLVHFTAGAATAGFWSRLVEEGSLRRGLGALLQQLSWNGITLIFLAVLVGRLRGGGPRALGFVRAPLRNVFPVLLLYLGSLFPITWLHAASLLVLDVFGMESEPQEAVRIIREAAAGGDLGTLVPLLLGAVVIAPVCEETIFRGFLYSALRARAGVPAALLVSSLVFALFHLSLSVLVPLVLVGWLLGWVFERTGSIAYSMLFHALFNSVQVAWMVYGGD